MIQYRAVQEQVDGATVTRVKPYIIDLSRHACTAVLYDVMTRCSANGTFLNNQKVEPQRYYELREKDVIKFGVFALQSHVCGGA